jgi:hypothetical protein
MDEVSTTKVFCLLTEAVPEYRQVDWSKFFNVSQANISQWKAGKNGMKQYNKVMALMVIKTDSQKRLSVIKILNNKKNKLRIKALCEAWPDLEPGLVAETMTFVLTKMTEKV